MTTWLRLDIQIYKVYEASAGSYSNKIFKAVFTANNWFQYASDAS